MLSTLTTHLGPLASAQGHISTLQTSTILRPSHNTLGRYSHLKVILQSRGPKTPRLRAGRTGTHLQTVSSDVADQRHNTEGGKAAGQLLDFDDLKTAARKRGFTLALSTIGPLYRISCRTGGTDDRLVAVSNGFVLPLFRLMHCDTLEVLLGRSKSASQADRQLAAGLGLLMRTAVFAHGHACGCQKAEILAINDDDNTHRRLVAYYRRMGFAFEREVGESGLSDLPHLLVWGGVGTRMNGDVPRLLQRWSRAVQASRDWKPFFQEL